MVEGRNRHLGAVGVSANHHCGFDVMRQRLDYLNAVWWIRFFLIVCRGSSFDVMTSGHLAL